MKKSERVIAMKRDFREHHRNGKTIAELQEDCNNLLEILIQLLNRITEQLQEEEDHD